MMNWLPPEIIVRTGNINNAPKPNSRRLFQWRIDKTILHCARNEIMNQSHEGLSITMPATGNFFDTPLNRRQSDSAKWNNYDEEILPLWVADMDFLSPPAVVEALHKRVDLGVFGYAQEPARLRELICARMETLYHWHITAEQILFLPGLVSGLNLVASASADRGSGILMNSPIYPPFLSAPQNQERQAQIAPLALTHRHDTQGRTFLHYEIDFDALTGTVQPNTRLFMFCNPHNPVGRVYTQAELEQVADFCLRHDLDICSDEIHSDLLIAGNKHIPIAAISPQLAERSITLLAPSKTYNLPGLGCSLAIIPNSELRQRVQRAAGGIIPHVNLLGFVAATAAYEQGGPWLEELKVYLTENRDIVFDFFKQQLPKVEMTRPEGTYLAWLDFRAYGIEDPYQFFLDRAKVGLTSGSHFGEDGKGFARLNFGTTKQLLNQALQQMADAVTKQKV
jgi:cysteine-S-conjugate beta-lyase